MVRLQGKRLVRAFGIGLLVLLLVGGGTGFATATAAEDDVGAVLAAPRPGDRAHYELEDRVIDRDEADPSMGLPKAWMDVEWLPERVAPTAGGVVATVRPLSVTHESDYWQQVYEQQVDAADGAPVSRVTAWSEPYTFAPLIVPGLPAEGQGTTSGRNEVFAGLGPCGFSHDAFGRRVGAGDVVQVYGGCDMESTQAGTPFEVVGWTNVGKRHALRLVPVDDALPLELVIDPTLPVPVRVVARMPESYDHTFLEGRAIVAKLKAFEPGQGDYSTAPKVPPSPLLQVPRAARTDWMLDDSGVAHPFPLREAYAYALDPASYAADSGGESVPDFVARHPSAYLAYAWNAHGTDSNGNAYDGWGLAWSDGERGAVLGKIVVQYPALLVAGLPDAVPAPKQRTMEDWDPESEAAMADIVPPAHRLPPTLPTAAGTTALSASVLQALGYPEPNAYGFLAGCYGADCFTTHVFVFAGHTDFSPSNLDAMLRDQQSRHILFGVHEDGKPASFSRVLTDQEAPVAVLPATSPPPPQASTDAAAAQQAVWSPPSSTAVAGLSFLALVASALYYFWPALKGAGLGLFSRIEDDKVLEHPTRRRVHDAIVSEPGIHFQALARKAGLGRGNLDHHLRKMLDAGVLTKVQNAGYTCYFPKGAADHRVMQAAPLLRSGGSRAILQAVAARPGASSRDLAAALGLAPSTVSYHLKRLQDAGLVAPNARAGVTLTPLGTQASAAA